MKKHLLALSMGVGVMILAVDHATAQSANCAPRGAIVERLESKYGESRQSIGLGTDNAVVEVFASPDTGTWTILATRANGISCLIAAGQGFELLAEGPTVSGEPT